MKSAMSKLLSELCGFWISSSGQHPLNLTVWLSCIGVPSAGSVSLSCTGVGQLQTCSAGVHEPSFSRYSAHSYRWKKENVTAYYAWQHRWCKFRCFYVDQTMGRIEMLICPPQLHPAWPHHIMQLYWQYFSSAKQVKGVSIIQIKIWTIRLSCSIVLNGEEIAMAFWVQ